MAARRYGEAFSARALRDEAFEFIIYKNYKVNRSKNITVSGGDYETDKENGAGTHKRADAGICHLC